VPEGDSLHRVAARLQVLVGERIAAESPSPRGQATGVARAVDGRVLERAEAVGKNLLLRFDGGVVVRSHLRMTGRWSVQRLSDQRCARGRPWLVLRGGDWEATQWNGPVLTLDATPIRILGPDVLGSHTSVDSVVRDLRRCDQGRLVGEVLVDQRVVAGIGNMWVAEMLWRARISPWSRLE
jgi:endonuclease-8